MSSKKPDPVAVSLLGELPTNTQRGVPPLTAEKLQELLLKLYDKGKDGPKPSDGTVFAHCRACGSFMSYFWDYPDLYPLHLTNESVIGHYVEASECCWCNRSVGFAQPRLLPLPVGS